MYGGQERNDRNAAKSASHYLSMVFNKHVKQKQKLRSKAVNDFDLRTNVFAVKTIVFVCRKQVKTIMYIY